MLSSRLSIDEAPSPIRVALVLSMLDGAGAERQTVSLATHFRRSSVEPTVVPLKPFVVGPNAEIDVSTVTTWSPGMRDGFDWPGIRRFAAYLRESRFDAVLCANQYATLLTLMARRVASVNTPVWSVYHSSPGHIGTDVRSRVQFAMYQSALRYCAGLIYVSDLQRQVWQKRKLGAGIPHAVVNNGIDLTPFLVGDDAGIRQQLGWKPEDYVVGVCAHLRPEKRVIDLVVAVRHLLAQGLPARLLIVGDGPCRPAIEDACREQLGPDRWSMAGMQSHVAPFIQACDAMALVSEVEAFSVVILECMASAKPLVVTDVGGAREQIEPGVHGYIVPVAEPEQIANRLAQLWCDGTIRNFGAAARASVAKRFSVASMVEQYTQLLVASVKRSKRPNLG